MTDINDVIAERIEATRQRIAADKARREQLAAARRAGLAKRHARRLYNLNPSNDTLAASGA